MAIGALVGMGVTAWWATRSVRSQANGTLAQAVATYLSLVTPRDRSVGLNPARLLSASSSLAGSSFWNAGLQAALGNTPLLADTIGLGSLPPEILVLVEQAPGPILLHDQARVPVAVARLLDHDLWNPVGWVAVWNGVPPTDGAPVALGLALLASLAIAFSLGSTSRVPRWIPGALAATALLAAWLGFDVRRTAVQATDLPLLRIRRLIEIAASADGVRAADLPAIAPGPALITEWVPQPDQRAERVGRERAGGEVYAVLVASLQGGTGLRIRVLAGESRLALVWVVLAGWTAVAAAALLVGRPGGTVTGRSEGS